MIASTITGVGSYIPAIKKKNDEFSDHCFLSPDGTAIPSGNSTIIKKFKAITGIEERRYASSVYNASDLGFFAAQKAIDDANINPEELDYIILAHNFGDVSSTSIQSDLLPSLATRVKHKLGIESSHCVAYDILFGCPGWIQGVIQADTYIKSGIATKVLVIGSETLSRVLDKHDRDSMIYSDGAGACIVEKNQGQNSGILSHAAQTFSKDEAFHLFFARSFDKKLDSQVCYIKMHGRKIYEFALKNVPIAMKLALDRSEISIDEVKKIFIHQANEKMDEAIIKRFFGLYGVPVPKAVMPMSIHKLGNSSVATVPTLLDLVLKGTIENQSLNRGDVTILASVGAGMNINAIVYRY